MTRANGFSITGRQAMRLTVLGFATGYVALMFLLVSLTSPHFDGYRHVIGPALGGLALIGAVLMVVARIAGPRPNRS